MRFYILLSFILGLSACNNGSSSTNSLGSQEQNDEREAIYQRHQDADRKALSPEGQRRYDERQRMRQSTTTNN